MRHKRMMMFILTFVLVIDLTACGEQGAQFPAETVTDLFVQPSETSDAVVTVDPTSEDTGGTQDSESSEPQPSGTNSVSLGNLNHGFGGEPKRDENGRPYREYRGGEMVLPYEINATGRAAQDGIGILLFLDGRPQPYKCSEDDTYSYIHTFYPTDGETYITELIFTPVTGQEGDMLEIYGININCPSIYASDGSVSPLFSLNSVGAGTQLKFVETPAEVDYGLNFDRVISQTVTHLDVSSAEIQGWSTIDLEENYESHLYVNNHSDTDRLNISGITATEPISLRFEIWGSPYIEYGLVFFVDNQPISTDPEDVILFGMASGKKIVVETQIDFSDFERESYIYAVLVPRNYRSSIVPTACFIDRSKTFYLFGDE